MYKGINIGDRLSNSDIQEIFGGRNMGGLRFSEPNKLLIVINNSDVDFFPDQHIIVNDEEIIIYFGEGNYGDQSITRGNKRLYESNRQGTPLHYFIKEKSRNYPYNGRRRDEYIYNGRVELIDKTPKHEDFYTDDGILIAKAKTYANEIPTLLGYFTHKEAFEAIKGPYRAHYYKRFNRVYPYLDLDNEPRSVIIFPLRKLEG